MSVVRPEFGPTLPELAGPHLAKLPRAARLGALAALAVFVVAALAFVLSRGEPPTPVVVRDPVAFNLVYDDDALRRVDPTGEGVVLSLRERPGRPQLVLDARPFTLPAYRGDSSAALLGLSVGAIERLRAQYPDVLVRGEGRFRTNESPGYQISFQTKVEGKTAYGKRFLLVPGTEPEEAPREGIELTLVSQRSDAIPRVDAVGANGPLKRPLRSFRFGTERP